MSSMSSTIFSTLPLLQTSTLCVLELSRKSDKILNYKDNSVVSCFSDIYRLPTLEICSDVTSAMLTVKALL